MRKLGYNKGDNPWMVAQQFLWTYEMGQDYLQQVADFICQNANVSMSDVGMGNEGAMDPLSGRYAFVFSSSLCLPLHFDCLPLN